MSSNLERFQSTVPKDAAFKQAGDFALVVGGSILPCWFHDQMDSYYDFERHPLLFLSEKSKGRYYFDSDQLKRMAHQAYQSYKQADSAEAWSYWENFQSTWEAIQTFHPVQPDDLSHTELQKKLTKAHDLLQQIFCHTFYAEIIDQAFIEEYADTTDTSKIVKASNKVCFEDYEIKKLKAIQQSTSTPTWIGASYDGGKRTSPETKSRDGIDQEISEKENRVKTAKAEVQNSLESLSASNQDLLRFLIVSNEMRDTRKLVFKKISQAISTLAGAYVERKNMQWEQHRYIHVSDIATDREITKKLLQQRRKGTSLLANRDENSIHPTDYEQAVTKIEGWLHGDDELDGTVACEGTATGPAKIILGEDDFDKFNEGDILVTSMTRPNYVPLMKRAAGIITDEGGITCHAAIISRELNTPCVIGTGNATQALQDGDQVAVTQGGSIEH